MVKKLKELKLFVESKLENSNKDRRAAALLGNPSVERIGFGAVNAYITIIAEIDRLLAPKISKKEKKP